MPPEPAPPIRDYLQAKRARIYAAWNDSLGLVAIEGQIDNYLRGYRPVYELRDELRARIAELRGPVKLPRASKRTAKQEKIAQCPRCMGKIEQSTLVKEMTAVVESSGAGIDAKP